MSEQRRRFRAPADLQVYWRPSSTGEDWQTGELMDISSGGARLRSTNAPIHHHITLSMPIQDGLPSIVAPSTLVRIEAQLESGEFVWALAFVSVDPATQARLARFAFSEARQWV